MHRPNKLTAPQVRAIRTRRAAGETQLSIAADYGVDPSAIAYQTRGIRVLRRAPFPVERAVGLLRIGCTRKQAALRLGVSVPTLWKYLKRAGVPAGARFSSVSPQKIAA